MTPQVPTSGNQCSCARSGARQAASRTHFGGWGNQPLSPAAWRIGTGATDP